MLSWIPGVTSTFITQAKLVDRQPAEAQHKAHLLAPPPTAVLGFAPAEPPSPALSLSHTPDMRLATGQASLTANGQVQPMDYGAPWAVAAAENSTPNSDVQTSAPDKNPHVANPAVENATPYKSAQPTPGKDIAPSPNTVPPKRVSSLTDSLAHQRPSTPGFLAAPFLSTTPAAVPLPSPALLFGAPAQAVTPASWNVAGSQAPAFLPDSTQQQQQATVDTPTEQAAVPVLANGPSTQNGNKGHQAVSSSSDGSRDTSVNLYPFPSQRSAQDRLEGIVSTSPCAQDDTGLYVFGSSRGMPAENEMPSSAAVFLPSSHGNGNHMASPSGPHQVQCFTCSLLIGVLLPWKGLLCSFAV